MDGGIESAGRAINKLSDRKVRAFVSQSQKGTVGRKKLSDGGGLYVTLTPAGTAVWRLKYRLGGKEGLYSIGPYPVISLEAARTAREEAKALVRVGRDPVKARQVSRVEATTASDTSFAGVAAEWLEKRKRDWSGIHHDKSSRALERDVLPLIGKLPVSEITPGMMANVIDTIMKRGVRDTAAKVLWHCVCIFRFAQARGLCAENPAVPVREMLPRRRQTSRRPALLDIDLLRDVLRRADLASLSPSVRLAQRLCAFTAMRIGNVVEAQWSEFDLDSTTPSWSIPRAKMKVRERDHDHRVLLGPTIAAELRAWRDRTGGKGYVFPSPIGNDHITRESLEKVYRVTLGLAKKHTLHGWRAAFATLARDAGFARDVVELTLDHVHDTAVARAYDRGERMDDRIRLMSWWDEQLKPLNDPAVLPFKAVRAG